MYITELSEDELRQLYDRLVVLTENFKIIRPEVLMADPLHLSAIRLICQLTHSELTKQYHKNYGKILGCNPYEQGHIKLGHRAAIRLTAIFNENLPQNPSLDILINRLKIMHRYRKSHQIGSHLEDRLEGLMQMKKIPYEKHVSILGKSDILHRVDFVIPSKKNPMFIVECKVTRALTSQTALSNAKSMALTAIDLSKEGSKFIAVIEGNWGKNSLKLLNTYCDVYTVEKLGHLVGLLASR